jgi:two-component system, cell cycle response regulator DivK
VTAANGGETLFLASKLSPDLIIMDLSMPVLDGLDTTRLLKSHPPTVAIPIIALTPHAADRRREATDAGCLLVVAKPVDLAALEREIRRIVQRVS